MFTDLLRTLWNNVLNMNMNERKACIVLIQVPKTGRSSVFIYNQLFRKTYDKIMTDKITERTDRLIHPSTIINLLHIDDF